MPVLVDFSEEKNIAYLADYKVFIFGVEVTEFVVGSIAWTMSDKNGPSTANFVMQNAEDNFVITKENLGISVQRDGTLKQTGLGKFRTPSEDFMYSELPKKLLFQKKKKINDDVKKDLYPVNLKNIILHKNDTLRIFIMNPINEREWYPAFTGYINDVSKSQDYITGQSNITISCYDIRAQMQKMRVSKSPTYGQREVQVITTDPESFFGDLINPNNNNHPFAGSAEKPFPYEKAMEHLMVGQDIATVTREDDGRPARSTGVGKFDKGDLYFFDTEGDASEIHRYDKGVKVKTDKVTNADLLNEWYNVCLFSNRSTDFKFIEPLSLPDVDLYGFNCEPGGLHAPDTQKFLMLLPKGGTKTESLVLADFSQGVEEMDFSNRWEIIKEFSDTIDYQFWTTGLGDMVFEFPMYEFLPTDFGYKNILTVDDFLISDDIADEQGDIPTVLTVTGGIGGSTAQTQTDVPQKDLIPRVIIANPALTARLGIQNEEHQFPTVTNKKSLQILANVEYFKRLSETSSMSMSFSWRPWLLPNKPLYNKEAERIGVSTSVTHRLNFFADCATDITLAYLRKRANDGSFVFLDGSQSVVASYRKAWDTQFGNSIDTGAVIIDATTGKTTGTQI